MAAAPVPSLRFEREAWRAGAFRVAGVDEVGVGVRRTWGATAAVVALPAGRTCAWLAAH